MKTIEEIQEQIDQINTVLVTPENELDDVTIMALPALNILICGLAWVIGKFDISPIEGYKTAKQDFEKEFKKEEVENEKGESKES